MAMILSIDVGNSSMVFGCIDGDSIRILDRIQTDPERSAKDYTKIIYELLKKGQIDPSLLEDAIISSVVPAVNAALKDALYFMCGKEPLFVEPDTKTGLIIEGDSSRQLGIDVIVGCAAAMERYPLPLAVIDIGTASTISAVDRSRRYLGGMILPGPRLLAQALSSGTALLPEVRIEAPDSILGQNTDERIKSGIIYGSAALIDGTMQRIEALLGEKPTAVATGGFAPLILPHCNSEVHYEELLILEGLARIYRMNRP